MPKLTKRRIDAENPGDRRRFVWDSELKGFGLCVHPPSRRHPKGSKVYVARYRTTEGRDRRVMLGAHGALTPDQARKLAAQTIASARAGGDPAEQRRVARTAPTITELKERYVEEHLPKKKPKSVREDRRILETYILPELGRRKVAEVTHADISRLHARMKKTPIMANRVLALLHTLFELADRWEMRPDGQNPCRHVKRYREQKRERFLSDEEIQKLGKALAEVERGDRRRRSAVAAIRLLALTGARKNEILRLRWEHVDVKRRVAQLPDSKTGKRTLRLEDAALEVLGGLPRSSPWVFPSPRKPDAPMEDVRKTLGSVLEKAGLEGVRVHDLRHTKASVGADLGLSLPMIGELLGHARAATTERYAHLAEGAARSAEQRVQGRIGAALRGRAPANVVPLHKEG